ncbi:MAG: hypothetical protein NTY36_01420 [Deltaproteobacteria bacterium]|nr:hypothetical protein [Deltaproteobacteria bacterium]
MADKKSFECDCGVLVGVDEAKERDQKVYVCPCCGRSYYRWSPREVRPLGRPLPIKPKVQVG